MKKIIVIICLLPGFILSRAQFSTSIESIRGEFHALSSKADEIIHPYDSLINLKDQINKKLQYEIEIYKSCETAFRDKMLALEKRGDRIQKREISEYRYLTLRIAELENEKVFSIFSFNHWNKNASSELKNFYEKKVIDEKKEILNLDKELSKYITKISSLQDRAEHSLSEYDSCRINCQKDCDCSNFLITYRKHVDLGQKYMKKYREMLLTRKELDSLKTGYYHEYKNKYNSYYTDYQVRKKNMDDTIERLQQEINLLESRLIKQRPVVYEMVYAAMEEDIIYYSRDLIHKIKKIDREIENEFGSYIFYNYLKDMQRMADIMVTTLNPEMNFLSVLDKIAAYNNHEITENTAGRKLQEISFQYGDILDKLKTAIRDYDAIPYFVLNAYPQYANEVVDENLEIINDRLAFSNESLEYRTKRFLTISELDLSDTNFSLDLIFKGHENIQKLDLSNTAVSSVKYLKETNIRWLDLSNTQIDTQDIEYLKEMRNLEYLDLSNTGLSRKDIHNVCYHLKVRRKNCKAD